MPRIPGLAADDSAALRPARPAGPRIRVVLDALPFIIMAVVATADALVGPRFGFLTLLSLGPALAAVSLTPVQTVLVGALAMVVALPLGIFNDLLESRREVIALATIAGVTVAGAVASAARRRGERELANVSAIAEATQRVLLRPVPPRMGPLAVAVRYISASASARVGGDVYEVIATPRAVRIIVADVQGKGLEAVQTAAVVLGAFRESAYDAAGLPDIAARIELSLERQTAEEEFVTAVLAEVRDGAAALEILNCGHPSPLLLGDGEARFIDPAERGLPLGLARLAASARAVSVTRLDPGERVLFYTDGISEARDKAGEFYPIHQCGALMKGQDLDPALDRLQDDVIRYVGHQLRDDAAMLLISYQGPGSLGGHPLPPGPPRGPADGQGGPPQEPGAT